MKRIFAFILSAVLVLSFAACSNWSVEVKEPENPAVLEPSEDEAPEMPLVTSFIKICAAEGDEILPEDWVTMSAEQCETLLGLLRESEWQSPPEDWQGKGSLVDPLTFFINSGDGTLYIGKDGEQDIAMLKWGENQKYMKIFFIPEGVAEDVSEFRSDIEQNGGKSDPPPLEEISSEEYPALAAKYLAPLAPFISMEWYSDELDPEILFWEALAINYNYVLGKADYCAFFGIENKLDSEEWKIYRENGFPAEEMEAAVTSHFNVSAEQMRYYSDGTVSPFYDPETNCYVFPKVGGFGEEYFPRIVYAGQSGDVLVINYDLYYARSDSTYGMENYFALMDENGILPYSTGFSLSIRLDGDNFSYISNIR